MTRPVTTAEDRHTPACAVVGEEVPPRAILIEQADIVRFAGACGDFNPLHFDPERARGAGFAAPIAMGQMTAGILGSWIADWCGIERLQDFAVTFVRPVVAGDTLVMTGVVAAVEPDDTGTVARLEVRADANGQVVITGTATVAVHDHPEREAEG